MKLIAYWGDETADFNIPQRLKWENGQEATLEDYRLLPDDVTRSEHFDDHGVYTVYDPDSSARVWFSRLLTAWVCTSPDGDLILPLTNPNATDKEISDLQVGWLVTWKLNIERNAAQPA